jgi:hypothetical protein
MADHNPLTEQRIAHIMGMMRRWEWKRGVSGPILAKEWGLSIEWLKDLSAEASKRVRAEVTDPERVSGTVGSALSKVLHDSMDDGDRKSVIDASKAWAQIVGAMAPTKVDVTATTTDATPAKAAEIMRRRFGAVTPAKKDDDDESGSSDPSGGAAGG